MDCAARRQKRAAIGRVWLAEFAGAMRGRIPYSSLLHSRAFGYSEKSRCFENVGLAERRAGGLGLKAMTWHTALRAGHKCASRKGTWFIDSVVVCGFCRMRQVGQGASKKSGN